MFTVTTPTLLATELVPTVDPDPDLVRAMTASRRSTPMTLHVSAAVASARTELAAFDRALVTVGAANYNLVRLSSVIPPGSTVVTAPRLPAVPGGRWGDRLYVVYAEQRANRPGDEAWAGVGWVQDEETGAGLFVEHEGDSEGFVRGSITASLEELQLSRGLELGPIQMCVTGACCAGDPCCALVLCTYQAEPWDR